MAKHHEIKHKVAKRFFLNKTTVYAGADAYLLPWTDAPFD